MPPKAIHVLGVDPGGTTGWALITIPRASLFGFEEPQILDWDYDEITGDEVKQVNQLASLAREIQGLDYKVGPAIVVEDFDNSTRVNDPEVFSPVRIGAMMVYAASLGKFCDSKIMFQSRSLKSQMTDERLRRRRMFPQTPGGHAADAIRHALVALRRASASDRVRDVMWDRNICTI